MANTGHMAYVLAGKEATYGTAVDATKDLGLVQNLTWTDENTPVQVWGLNSIDIQDLDWGAFKALGSLDLALQHGRILEYLLGGTVTHDSSNSPDIKHTFSLTDTLPSMTLEDGSDGSSDIVQQYAGVKVLSGNLSLALDGVFRGRFDLMAKTLAVPATNPRTGVVSSLPTFKFWQATLSTGVMSSESALAEVQSAEININNINGGAAEIYGFGSRLLTQIEANQRLITTKFTVGFANNTEYKRFLSGSGAAGTAPTDNKTSPTLNGLLFSMNNGLSAGSGRREFSFDFSNVLYAKFTRPIPVAGYIYVDIEAVIKTVDSIFNYDTITSGNY